VLEEAQSIASGLARENEQWLAVVEQDSPHLMKLLIDALERRAPLNRFADLR
jgi:molybdopterin-guanine dinucleotide biosynthesis protein A